MKKDLIKPINSSFLSCEKDVAIILDKLFTEDKVHANELKRLLVINTKDCLDMTNERYQKIIDEYTVKRLFDEGYIRLTPKLTFEEHDEVRSYILLSFDNFTPSGNNEFRDCIINFDVVSHIDYWNLQNFQLRPIKIIGYIDGLLNKTKLTGIGELNFLGANELILDKELSGYTIMYAAVHGNDDVIPAED